MKINFTLFSLFFVVCFSAVSAQPPVTYYNNAAGKSCSDLKTALKNIISTGTPQPYDDLWAEYASDDVKTREVGAGSAQVIYDIYSDKPGPNNDPYNFTPGTGTNGQQDQGLGGTAEGQFYNREHSIPLSWFGGNTNGSGAASDYLHIFPTDKMLNNRRANFPYGQVGSATFTSLNGSKLGTSSVAGINGTVFEPIDSFKGDVARAFLYFVTRYQDLMPSVGNNAEAQQAFEPNTFPSVDVPFLQMMINWHNLDPVSGKEMARNNAAYSYQGNRNPYIDHPEYVDIVWNSTCAGLGTLPVSIVFFGAKLAGDQVKLEWNVATEINLAQYEIERSFNGMEYSKIGEVKATGVRNYTYSDNANEIRGDKVLYRLKKVDKDGQFDYSAVVTLKIPFNTTFSVYPNPAKAYVNLRMNRAINGKVTVQLAEITGKILLQKTVTVNGNNLQISTTGVAAGTYLLKIRFGGEQYMQKIIVAR